MDHAPYFDDIAQGPKSGHAWWSTTSDGVRIRTALWPLEEGQPAKGTVFLLCGRTEFAEKYGRTAVDFAAKGYASLAIDWRGQGIADRLLKDRQIGHIEDFTDYQKDLDAVIALADAKDMPKPWFILGHSMGGCIGLRVLYGKHPFSAASFSAPMWGIGLTNSQKIMVRFLAPVLSAVGLGNGRAPGTKAAPYMMWHPFKDNQLTSDPENYTFMQDQLTAQPDLGLGGPSTHWVNDAIRETTEFAQKKSPDFPVICFLGLDEAIVNTASVRDRMARWPSGELVEIENARHEIPMETPAIRKLFVDRSCDLFDATPR